MFHATKQRGYFEVEGERVGGRYWVGPDGGLDFFINIAATSPIAMQKVRAHMDSDRGSRISIKVPLPPIFENSELVTVGFVTAAYLLWFDALGYSWVLQKHLDPVRKQIHSVSLGSLPSKCCALISDPPSKEPWIGIGQLGGELALLAGIADRLILFPPADRSNFYSLLPADYEGLRVDDVRVLNFYKRQSFLRPIGVVFDDRLIIAPDVLFRGGDPTILHFPPDGSGPHILKAVSDERYNQLKQRPHRRVKVKPGFEIPTSDTGRTSE